MSRRQYVRRLIFSLLASTTIPNPGWTLEPSGSAVRVSSHANASGPGGARVLNAPGDVFQGDEIVTDAGGQAQIRFVDDTRFVVGPNSRVVIDEFVFNSKGTATDVAFNSLKGTFRFISGNSPHDAYSIRTPTMTLGVRGTILDVRVLGGGFSYAAWRQGGGTACVVPGQSPNQQRTECEDTEAGDVVGAPPGGGFANFRPGELRQVLIGITTGLGPGLGAGFGGNTAGNYPDTDGTPDTHHTDQEGHGSPY
jgi:hypothetical protein